MLRPRSAPRASRAFTLSCAAALVALLTGCPGTHGTFLPEAGDVPEGGRGDMGTTTDGPGADRQDRDIPPVPMDGTDGGGPTDGGPDGGPDGGGGCVPERCDDGLDNDCDGVVDNGCTCLPGETSRCYRGPVSTRGVGLCADGMMVCTGTTEFGTWGPCVGDVLPAPSEVCDTAALDENCNGGRNEGCECSVGAPDVPCGSSVGACRPGGQHCEGGMLGACMGAVGPVAEACDGIDNDCNGMVDDGLTRPCGSGVGACHPGTETCHAGAWGSCTGATPPGVESCNGMDDDCDGMTDEDLARSCGSAVGACREGTIRCAGGMWGMCEGAVGGSAEVCDGIDNDCNGMTDEALVRPCGTDVGACVAGTQACAAGAWGACAGSVAPVAEVCEGSVDENCDGVVDEGCSCTTGARRACGLAVGACRAGTQTCTAGAWGTCAGGVGPATELCDGVDNNCNGMTDEGCGCITGATRPCGSMVGACRPGTETCDVAGAWGACAGGVAARPEVCEGLTDENCNGMVDEGCVCTIGMRRVCGSAVGTCRTGFETCTAAGTWGACAGATGPAAEACDGLDNNCNGTTDEGCGCVNGAMRACGSAVGACRAGSQTCTAGTWGACLGGVVPGTEVCDGTVDENCDGMVDEGCACTNGAVRPCGSTVGACRAGSQTCAAGAWGTCTGGVVAAPEVCDGVVDQNCNGVVDDGCECTMGTTRPCGSAVGACTQGTQTCSAAGAWGACVGGVTPTTEVCDGIDSNCDGVGDAACACLNGQTQACGATNVGACHAGTQTCDLMGVWGTCVGALGPSAELCDGTVDENCSGVVDEGCACTNGQTRNCGSNTGTCTFGTQTCSLMGAWGTCTGGTGPVPETCNMLDDNCDGAVDEGGICPRFPPTAMCPAATSTLVGTPVTLSGSGMDPDGGSVTYQWAVSTRPTGSVAAPAMATAASTTFNPDVAGSYLLQLCVTDDEMVVSCCTVAVTATSPCVAPAVPAPTTCATSFDRRPIVEFPAVPAGVTYTLYAVGDTTPIAATSTVGQNHIRPPAPLPAPPVGMTTASVQLYVRACLDSDATCCTNSAPITTALYETCTTVLPAAGNITFSEYIVDGDGSCAGGSNPACEAGEAIEITNLSHCPVTLNGTHLETCGASCTTSARYMDFGAAEIVPPRGVYIAIRNRAASACPFSVGADDPGLFGIRVSTLAMNSDFPLIIAQGWLTNTGGSLRVAQGAYAGPGTGSTIISSSYASAPSTCYGLGYTAVNQCGESVSVGAFSTLNPNQIGRLWRPCDAVVSPTPMSTSTTCP